MAAERILSCFDRKNSELKWEINIDKIDFNVLKSILKPQNDNDLHLIYTINEANYLQLETLLDIKFNLDECIYEIGCFKI